jgi:hypothetical protein
MKAVLKDRNFLRDYIIYLYMISNNKNQVKETIDETIEHASSVEDLANSLLFETPTRIQNKNLETAKMLLN